MTDEFAEHDRLIPDAGPKSHAPHPSHALPMFDVDVAAARAALADVPWEP